MAAAMGSPARGSDFIIPFPHGCNTVKVERPKTCALPVFSAEKIEKYDRNRNTRARFLYCFRRYLLVMDRPLHEARKIQRIMLYSDIDSVLYTPSESGQPMRILLRSRLPGGRSLMYSPSGLADGVLEPPQIELPGVTSTQWSPWRHLHVMSTLRARYVRAPGIPFTRFSDMAELTGRRQDLPAKAAGTHEAEAKVRAAASASAAHAVGPDQAVAAGGGAAGGLGLKLSSTLVLHGVAPGSKNSGNKAIEAFFDKQLTHIDGLPVVSLAQAARVLAAAADPRSVLLTFGPAPADDAEPEVEAVAATVAEAAAVDSPPMRAAVPDFAPLEAGTPTASAAAASEYPAAAPAAAETPLGEPQPAYAAHPPPLPLPVPRDEPSAAAAAATPQAAATAPPPPPSVPPSAAGSASLAPPMPSETPEAHGFDVRRTPTAAEPSQGGAMVVVPEEPDVDGAEDETFDVVVNAVSKLVQRQGRTEDMLVSLLTAMDSGAPVPPGADAFGYGGYAYDDDDDDDSVGSSGSSEDVGGFVGGGVLPVVPVPHIDPVTGAIVYPARDAAAAAAAAPPVRRPSFRSANAAQPHPLRPTAGVANISSPAMRGHRLPVAPPRPPAAASPMAAELAAGAAAGPDDSFVQHRSAPFWNFPPESPLRYLNDGANSRGREEACRHQHHQQQQNPQQQPQPRAVTPAPQQPRGAAGGAASVSPVGSRAGVGSPAGGYVCPHCGIAMLGSYCHLCGAAVGLPATPYQP